VCGAYQPLPYCICPSCDTLAPSIGRACSPLQPAQLTPRGTGRPHSQAIGLVTVPPFTRRTSELNRELDMFTLQNVTLLQPEEVFAERLSSGALAAYLSAVREALGDYYASTDSPGTRALFIAVGPRAKRQFWLAGASLLPDEQPAVEGLARTIEPPAVKGGIAALALIYTVGTATVPQEQLIVPAAWLAVVERAARAFAAVSICRPPRGRAHRRGAPTSSSAGSPGLSCGNPLKLVRLLAAPLEVVKTPSHGSRVPQ
jgi:hypothetical protein